ncbi:Hypothetical predicted protein, partial [Olea europaea subsp. europaea]
MVFGYVCCNLSLNGPLLKPTGDGQRRNDKVRDSQHPVLWRQRSYDFYYRTRLMLYL